MAKTKAARTLSRPRIFTLHETADRLRPAEAFLDALAQSLPPGLKPGGQTRGDLARDGDLERRAHACSPSR
jgi:hypothetical protein